MVGTGINETLTKVFLAEAAKPTLVKKNCQDWEQNKQNFKKPQTAKPAPMQLNLLPILVKKGVTCRHPTPKK